MADEEALRDLLRERLRLDPEFRLLGLRLRDSRHIELRALGATSREQMEQILAEGMRGVLSADQRVRLVAGLKAFQGDRSRSALLQVIRSDPSPEVRAAALTAVGGMLDVEELFITAARALSDPHAGVRHAAIAQFQRIAPEKALPALVRQLKGDEDPVTLQAVAEQAESAFDPFVDLALGGALGGQEAMMVARVARYMHHPGLARVLSAVSRSESTAVREAVAQTWSRRADLLDPVALEAMTIDPAVSVRRASVAAWLGAKRFDRLAAMVHDPDPGVRLEVGLAFHSAPDAGPLEALHNDPDEMVRAAVFICRLLRGEVTEPPSGGRLSRAAAASAVRRTVSLESLRERARTAIDPGQRAAAALALAVLDDEVAYSVVRSDPVVTIREQVGRMLTGWRKPESA
jgi:hypothetical protein